MRDELSHALVEALYELELLPMNDDAALIGMYAVMDDLENAIERTKSLDPSQHNLLVLPEPRPLPGCGRPHRARA